MSEHRDVPERATHSPIRRAAPTRPSASGPGDRIASARDIASYFREDCRTLQDSLQLEMVAAQYLLSMRDVRTPQGVPTGDAVTAGVVAELERFGDALSAAILRALAHLGVGHAAKRSADALARLGERGTALPPEFADVAEAHATGAWRDCAAGGEYMLFVEFEHPLGRRHSLALFVEPRHGGTIKHLGLLGPLDELAPDGPFDPSNLDSLALPAAGALLRSLIDRSYGLMPHAVDDYRVLIAAARARTMRDDRPASALVAA